jgi:hypothetical protein
MRTITITRAFGDANFHVGEAYSFATGDEHFDGVIRHWVRRTTRIGRSRLR